MFILYIEALGIVCRRVVSIQPNHVSRLGDIQLVRFSCPDVFGDEPHHLQYSGRLQALPYLLPDQPFPYRTAPPSLPFFPIFDNADYKVTPPAGAPTQYK